MAGQATVSNPNEIDQSSQKAVVNWQGFPSGKTKQSTLITDVTHTSPRKRTIKR
ncbi:MAG: hypothetical protein Q8N30_08440 [Methylococcales bacterium]|nr:hypothetical protein [Methylococcales bacterium]